MKRLFLGALLLVVASGCRSNPYCLNCKDSGNGVIAPDDMTDVGDLAGTDDMDTPPDLLGQGGPCVPTNGGVEICDKLDNDCNGKIDDVSMDRLVGDPNNCGACGVECKFPHAFGQCVGGFDGGMPTCKANGCQPGYIDLDGDPTNGCEYVCTPTSPATEACDGKDNNCDGRIDEGFTTTWFDANKQMPKYDSALANCGQCGVVCSLGAGTVMACQGTGANGRGQCVVTACVNALDSMNVHQTYRHNPLAGNIDVTGCEVHCPKPAASLGNDCNPNGACTFPVETCNGLDDDCNFVSDDNLTDPGLNGPCPDGAPGKLCQDATTCGKGVCAAGTYKCVGGGLTCDLSVGPSPESCNGKDDDCNGKVDDPYTATWKDAGNQMPRYDSDKNNCGACTTVCTLPNAPNICRRFGADTVGSCATAGCNAGWNYVPKTDSDPNNPMCDVTTVGNKDSTQGTTGRGCFYPCPVNPINGESCDGLDNDCNGCRDDGITPPPIACSNLGVCAGQGVTARCQGAKGYKCDYSMVPNVSLDPAGNLAATELQCDNLDNNCEGRCDENFPNVGVSGAGCTNAPRTVKTCTAGQGVCQVTQPYACGKSVVTSPYNDIEQCTATANTAAAKDEECNGKDDDCDGSIDEASTSVIGATTYQGWHDKVVQVAVAADPFTGQAAHTVYAYQYEATRPDATGTTPGSQSQRACSVAGRLPWANVTLAQAQAACAAIKNAAGTAIGRLCSAWEWQQTCNGNAASGTHWSMSSSSTTYVPQVCNDAAQDDQRCKPGATPSQCLLTCNGSGQCTCMSDADCSPGFACNVGICRGSGAWPTGSVGTVGAGNQCFVLFGTDEAHDFSGNLQEWTSTPVTLKQGATASIAATGTAGQWQVNGLTNIFSTDAGAQLILTGATSAGNNGTFDIVSVTPSTSVVISNPNGSVQAGATITWKFVYNKLRGGNYLTNASGGDSCEFDFDIQKASFSNTNVGFRCCSDTAP
ncbi:MAG: hypothetical protein JWN44_6806 [Myxococcales bacterium]|nr:hypothetical protein [Myxococcales bacterium]